MIQNKIENKFVIIVIPISKAIEFHMINFTKLQTEDTTIPQRNDIHLQANF